MWASPTPFPSARAQVKKNVKGWALPAFKGEALELYQEVCEALAGADLTRLKQVCGVGWGGVG